MDCLHAAAARPVSTPSHHPSLTRALSSSPHPHPLSPFLSAASDLEAELEALALAIDDRLRFSKGPAGPEPAHGGNKWAKGAPVPAGEKGAAAAPGPAAHK